ncbi:membrane protein [Yersinia pseudotuberculosis]|nr:membrane protein [Yersinia pseudotuberculosis]
MKYNANITSLFGLSSLFGLYCAQGVPLGLAIFALPGILRSLGPICG